MTLKFKNEEAERIEQLTQQVANLSQQLQEQQYTSLVFQERMQLLNNELLVVMLERTRLRSQMESMRVPTSEVKQVDC